jgi:hypothetical protein
MSMDLPPSHSPSQHVDVSSMNMGPPVGGMGMGMGMGLGVGIGGVGMTGMGLGGVAGAAAMSAAGGHPSLGASSLAPPPPETGMSGGNGLYTLVVRQQPERARLCSFKEENDTSG